MSRRTGGTGAAPRRPRARTRAIPRAVGVATAVAATGVVLARALRRVEVVGSSMWPALEEGDRLLVLRLPGVQQPWPVPGAVVAVRDPRDPSRILVKRVASVDRRRGMIEVRGDAEHASTDSRSFGPVGRSALVGRAVYRYAPAGRTSRAPWPAEYHLT